MTDITMKCTNSRCDHAEKLTAERAAEGKRDGCIMCPKCFMPLEIKKIVVARKLKR